MREIREVASTRLVGEVSGSRVTYLPAKQPIPQCWCAPTHQGFQRLRYKLTPKREYAASSFVWYRNVRDTRVAVLPFSIYDSDCALPYKERWSGGTAQDIATPLLPHQRPMTARLPYLSLPNGLTLATLAVENYHMSLPYTLVITEQ